VRLLVSVATASEASAAASGGAHIVDAKNPSAGALGAVPLETFRSIAAVIGDSRPLTAALGDAEDERSVERDSAAFAAAGAQWLKIGFAGIADARRAGSLIAAAVRGADRGGSGVVAVAYADADGRSTLDATTLLPLAARSGARGLLIDTADKTGSGLRGLLTPQQLTTLIDEAHDAGLFVAVAGKLTADDLPFARECGADIVGVRGAACNGGRTSRIDVDRVRRLREICDTSGREIAIAGPAKAGHHTRSAKEGTV
jgi:uncharacterized protein (UPF0264 family)